MISVAVLAVLAVLAALAGAILLLLTGLLPATLLLLARLLLAAALLLAALLIALLLLTGALIGILVLVHSISFQRWRKISPTPDGNNVRYRTLVPGPRAAWNLGTSGADKRFPSVSNTKHKR